MGGNDIVGVYRLQRGHGLANVILAERRRQMETADHRVQPVGSGRGECVFDGVPVACRACRLLTEARANGLVAD